MEQTCANAIAEGPSQKEQILKYLREHGSITPREALDLFGCFRLGARIWELKRDGKRDGYSIFPAMVKDNGKIFARYDYFTEDTQLSCL